jgi:hypothetical protein
MNLEWRLKRKLFYFGLFAAFVFLAVLGLILILKPKPSCFDAKQNQKEEGVDCGGPCKPCVKNAKEPIVLWTRFFKTNEEKIYDLGALVKNPNYNLGADNLVYQFRLYDSQNILIAFRRGKTFLNAEDNLLIFEPGVFAGERTPARAALEIFPVGWSVVKEKFGGIKIKDKNFFAGDFSKVEAVIENQNLFPAENLDFEVALFDESGNAYEISRTYVESIEAEAAKKIVFSWPREIKEPAKIEVYWQKRP